MQLTHEYHIGDLTVDSMKNYCFKFCNISRKTLEITHIESTCGCVAAVLSSNTITPNQSVILSVTFTAPHIAGNKKYNIQLYNSKIKKPISTFTLSADIQDYWTVSPQKNLSFGEVIHGSSVTIMRILHNKTKQPFRIVDIYTESPEIFDFQMGEYKNGSIPIWMTMHPDNILGKRVNEFIIETDFEKQPRIKLPFYIKIIGLIQPQPSTIFLGAIKNGQTIQKNIKILVSPSLQQTVNITRFKSNDDEITLLKGFERTKNNEFIATIQFQPKKSNGFISKNFIIETDFPLEKYVKVPFSAVVIK